MVPTSRQLTALLRCWAISTSARQPHRSGATSGRVSLPSVPQKLTSTLRSISGSSAGRSVSTVRAGRATWRASHMLGSGHAPQPTSTTTTGSAPVVLAGRRRVCSAAKYKVSRFEAVHGRTAPTPGKKGVVCESVSRTDRHVNLSPATECVLSSSGGIAWSHCFTSAVCHQVAITGGISDFGAHS